MMMSDKNNNINGVAMRRCSKCRNHGVLVQLKGHKPFCRFRSCPCAACCQLDERKVATRIRKKKQQTIANGQVQDPPEPPPQRPCTVRYHPYTYRIIGSKTNNPAGCLEESKVASGPPSLKPALDNINNSQTLTSDGSKMMQYTNITKNIISKVLNTTKGTDAALTEKVKVGQVPTSCLPPQLSTSKLIPQPPTTSCLPPQLSTSKLIPQPPTTSCLPPQLSTSKLIPQPPTTNQEPWSSHQTSRFYPSQRMEIYPPQYTEIYPRQPTEISPPQRTEIYPPQHMEIYPRQCTEIYPQQRKEIYPPQHTDCHGSLQSAGLTTYALLKPVSHVGLVFSSENTFWTRQEQDLMIFNPWNV